MHYEGEMILDAPLQKVWEFVSDPRSTPEYVPLLKKLEIHDEKNFTVMVGIGVGSISGTFKLDFVIAEEIPPHSCKLVATGSGIKSTVELEAIVHLSEAPDQKTSFKWSAEAMVAGLIAGVGQRLLGMAAEKTMNEVFARMQTSLERKDAEHAGQAAEASESNQAM
ncbi:MAG: SRPBCC domain-containing protein [Peptococcaceae bacterium]|nr:SRPBCC domain-containing protein [Peptococcaceae bacterium]